MPKKRNFRIRRKNIIIKIKFRKMILLSKKRGFNTKLSNWQLCRRRLKRWKKICPDLLTKTTTV